LQIPIPPEENKFLNQPIVIKEAFSRHECRNIIHEIKKVPGIPSLSSGGVKSLLVKPNNPYIMNKIQNIFQFINDNFYNFDLSDIREMSFLEYQKDSFMNWHNDIGIPQDEIRNFNYDTRKITLSILLSDKNDFQGGNLLFRPDFPLVLDQGDVVGYPSYLMHSVAKLISGERYVLLVSANGPVFH
jgi:predicted 2-oxoglutarate/Fe(II)-dependent dioxygenase YbiX